MLTIGNQDVLVFLSRQEDHIVAQLYVVSSQQMYRLQSKTKYQYGRDKQHTRQKLEWDEYDKMLFQYIVYER